MGSSVFVGITDVKLGENKTLLALYVWDSYALVCAVECAGLAAL